LSPAAKRRAVDMLKDTLSMSERLACKAVGLARSTYRRLPVAQSPADPDAQLRAWLLSYATVHPCHGFRRAWAVLRYDEHREVNKKKIGRALLIAANEYAAVGVSGEENILNLDAGRALLAVHDRDEALNAAIAFTTGVHEPSAHLTSAVIAAASSDAELDRYLTDLLASITLQIRRILEVYRDRAWIRSDVTFDEVVETAAVLVSVDTYLRITHRDGWSVAAYQSWLRRMLAETVFVAPQKN